MLIQSSDRLRHLFSAATYKYQAYFTDCLNIYIYIETMAPTKIVTIILLDKYGQIVEYDDKDV